MNVEKAIADFGKALDSLDDVAKHLLNAADPEGTKKDLEYYQNALAECQRMDSLKGTSPTSFVAAISKSLREKPEFLALLDVNYESDCNVNFMTSDFLKKQTEDVAVMLPDGFYRPYLRYKISDQMNRFLKKQTEDVAVMLPDGFYRPYLRYKISDQMNRPTGNFPWTIKMVSASNIKEWIAFNSAQRLIAFAEKIILIKDAFPNPDTITKYIKEDIDDITTNDFERESFHASLEGSDGEIIGTTKSGQYNCHLPTTIKSLKDKLVGKIFERIAGCIANKVGSKISDYMLDKLKTTLKLDIEELRYLVPKETFQTIIVLYVQRVLVTSFLEEGASIFGLSLFEAGLLTTEGLATGAAVVAAAIAAKATAFELSFPVDINSERWRRKVAGDAFVVFKGERENLKEKVCKKAESEIDKMFRESAESLMKSSKEICDVGTNLQMTYRDHTVETFSDKDFYRTNAILRLARRFRKETSYLESLGCVAERDQFECVLRGKGRQQECGSEVVVILHEERKIGRVFTNVPLVYIDVQRKQEEIHKIQHFKKKNKIECMDEKTYQELRGKLDSRYLLSLANRHSNLVAIDICTTKSSMGGDIIEELTSIVIYCFAKGFVPIGENVFPKEIMGIQTDIREAYALALGTRDYNNPIGPGCSIGLENHDSTGSIGFFLRHKRDRHLAFLSSAHVLFDLNTLQDLANKNQENPSHECRVVQPSDTDSRAITLLTDRICGHVRSVHFNKTGEEKCKDFVVVASEGIRNPGNILQHPSISAANRHQSGCNNWPNGYEIQDIGIPSIDRDDNVTERSINKTVIKVGRTTDLTKGEYAGPIRMVNVRDGNGGSFILFDLIKIKACRSSRFSARGDSGAAIFLKFGNTLKPFGIVEASMMQTNLTVAIPITEVKTVCGDYELQPFDRQELGVQHDDDDENMMTMMVIAMIMMIAVVTISLNVDT